MYSKLEPIYSHKVLIGCAMNNRGWLAWPLVVLHNPQWSSGIDKVENDSNLMLPLEGDDSSPNILRRAVECLDCSCWVFGAKNVEGFIRVGRPTSVEALHYWMWKWSSRLCATIFWTKVYDSHLRNEEELDIVAGDDIVQVGHEETELPLLSWSAQCNIGSHGCAPHDSRFLIQIHRWIRITLPILSAHG